MTGMRRERTALAAVLLFLIPFGYWLRFRAPVSPELRDSSGGAVYVALWILFAALFYLHSAAWKIAAWVLSITCFLEFLQLWHPGWLEALRATFAGRVLLGTTFGWSDFPPYFVGALFGWLLLLAARRLRHSRDLP